MTYNTFRTGLTFADVRAQLDAENAARIASGQEPIWALADDAGARRVVLGRWRQLKLEMWDYYQSSQGKQTCQVSS